MDQVRATPIPRRYDADERMLLDNPPQPVAVPRPGHGTVYFNFRRDAQRDRVWTGVWVDPLPAPDPSGAIHGHSSVDGERRQVLEWVRAQPAANPVTYSERARAFVDLPDADDEIDI